LVCGRSWVRAPVESNQRLLCAVDRGFEHRSSQAKDYWCAVDRGFEHQSSQTKDYWYLMLLR
jgi:hypothetical protein